MCEPVFGVLLEDFDDVFFAFGMTDHEEPLFAITHSIERHAMRPETGWCGGQCRVGPERVRHQVDLQYRTFDRLSFHESASIERRQISDASISIDLDVFRARLERQGHAGTGGPEAEISKLPAKGQEIEGEQTDHDRKCGNHD